LDCLQGRDGAGVSKAASAFSWDAQKIPQYLAGKKRFEALMLSGVENAMM
jgi:hypothetical protein